MSSAAGSSRPSSRGRLRRHPERLCSPAMTAPEVVWLVVGLFSMALLLVMLLGLLKQLKRLTSSVAQLQREVQPVLQGIQQESERAQARAARVQAQAAEVREAGPVGRSGRRRSRDRAR